MGGSKRNPSSIKAVTHILQWWNLARLYFSQRKSKKYMNHLTHHLSSTDISIFSPEFSKFCYITKYRFIAFWYIISIYFNFSWVFIDCYNKHGQNWNKGYYVICSVYDVINKILLHDSNYIVDECISEVKNTQIDNTKGLDVVMPMSNLIGYSDNCSELFVMSHMLVKQVLKN